MDKSDYEEELSEDLETELNEDYVVSEEPEKVDIPSVEEYQE